MFLSKRISTTDSESLKRDVESTFEDVSSEFTRILSFLPTEYTVVEPVDVAPFQTALVSSKDSLNWTGQTISGLAAVFMYYIEPVPPQMVDNPNIDINAQWCKVFELPGTALPPP